MIEIVLEFSHYQTQLLVFVSSVIGNRFYFFDAAIVFTVK